MTDGDVERVVAALRIGDVAIVPTDTVYGLIADPESRDAMQRLFDIKRRPDGVPVAVLVGSTDQARSLVVPDGRFERLAAAHWPGALTIVAPLRSEHALHIGSTSTIGVRSPDHGFVNRITRLFGPIAATSANVHGAPTVVSATEAEAEFGHRVDVIIDGGEIGGTASTVVDVSCHPPRILRQGSLVVDVVDLDA